MTRATAPQSRTRDNIGTLVRAVGLIRERPTNTADLPGAIAQAFDTLIALESTRLGLTTTPVPADEAEELIALFHEEHAQRSCAQNEQPLDLGSVYESLLSASSGLGLEDERKRRGTYFTPSPLVEHLLDTSLDPVIEERLRGSPDPLDAVLSIRVCDPSCGSGRFLLGAARRMTNALIRLGCDEHDAKRDVVTRCIHGVELDPISAKTCRAMLALDARDPTLIDDTLEQRIVVADAFEHRFDAGPFDVVVGNPPFLSQLSDATARDREQALTLSERFGGAVTRYADTASAFLLLSLELTRDGGRVAMVLPRSTLATGDSAPVRARALEFASLTHLWVSDANVFDGACVDTCAPTFELSIEQGERVLVTSGASFEAARPVPVDPSSFRAGGTWASLGAGASGVPMVSVSSDRTLRDIATATADFRDEYYGLQGNIVESDALPPDADPDAYPQLVTSGLIDLGVSRWGERATRIHKRAWEMPRVDRGLLERDQRLASWMTKRLVPKVLIATQTRVIEAWVDEEGAVLPSTPLITLVPRDGDALWLAATAVASPVASAIALREYAGAALSTDAIKLSARQVLSLPLPIDDRAWERAGEVFRSASHASSDDARHELLLAFGREMTGAYGLARPERDQALRWWAARLLPRRRTSSRSKR